MAETVNETPVSESQLTESFLTQKSVKRGEVVAGTIVSVDREGAWVDVGAKSEGIVPSNEMQTVSSRNPLKEGDKVTVFIMQEEREDGRPVFSLDRARRQKGWHDLEEHLANGETLEVEITTANRGGLVAVYEGVQGFIPSSQVAGHRDNSVAEEEWLTQRVGQLLKIKVIELNRQRRRLIFSERQALREQREKERERVLAELKDGEIRRGRVTGIHNFGVFVDLGGMEGLVPLSELSWQRVGPPTDVVSVGAEIDVLVMKVDRENKRAVLSLRRIKPHPWEGIQEKYKVGQRVTATITKLVPFGAFARLDDSIDGLIHISELAPRRITHPQEVVHEGDVLELKVLSIDPERRHLRLSLRQAQEEL
ncbi:MAG: S1 RNA-binding domain-containing protein [Chloroflexi bacterium]|nr:S1 RNA-binding domain-containing protein [Chloroflexota bacterium]